MNRHLKSVPKGRLRVQELNRLVKSYDVIGDIAIIRIPDSLMSQSSTVARAIIRAHKHVRTVLRQASAVSGDFRLRRLDWVLGEKKTETLYREFGCVFKVDLARCYFSPRLSFERMRVARAVQPDETVVNMFAGVGGFSILMAKHGRAETVYSIDVNPSAVRFMRENVRLNRVQGRVVPILGDAKEVIVGDLKNVADRVVMPLPEKAFEYLDCAILALKLGGGWIHYYDFEHALKREDPVKKVKAKVSEKLQKLDVDFVVAFGRAVRHTGPNWYQVALDIEIRCKRRMSKGVSRR